MRRITANWSPGGYNWKNRSIISVCLRSDSSWRKVGGSFGAGEETLDIRRPSMK